MRRRVAIILAVLLIPNLALVSCVLYATWNRVPSGDGSADDFAERAAQNPLVSLKDTDADVRIEATESLAHKARDTMKPDDLPALRTALRDSHAGVRRVAGEGLRWLGQVGVDVLVKALDDPRKEVRISAAKSLLRAPVDVYIMKEDFAVLQHDKEELAKRVLNELENSQTDDRKK